MPTHPYQTNFTGGEITRQLLGRVDLAQYRNGAECIINMVVKPHGGAARRAGLAFAAMAKYDDKVAHLIRFEFSRDVSYLIEAGDLYFRFFTARALLRAASSSPATTMTLSATTGFSVTATAGAAVFTNTAADRGRRISFTAGGLGEIKTVSSTTVATIAVLTDFASTSATSGNWSITGVPVEVTTAYTEAQVPQLRTAQSGDVMYITHPSHPPRKLRRLTTTSFEIADVAFDPAPLYEVGISLTLTGTDSLTLSASSPGTGRTATFAGAHAPFLAADVGRTLVVAAGRATITAVTSTTVATITIHDAFSGTSLTTGTAVIGGSPYARLEIDNKDRVGAGVTIVATDPADTTQTGATFPTPEWNTINTFRSSDVGRYIVGSDGIILITTVSSATQALGTLQKSFTGLQQANKNAFTDGDFDSGPWKIIAGQWQIEGPTWTAARGYPGVVAFVDQRLWFAATNTEPDTKWGSVVGDFENFGPGLADSDSQTFTLAGGGNTSINEIRWIKHAGRMLVGTLGAEYSATGPNDEPISTTIRVKDQTTHGSDYNVDALRVSNAVIFLQRGARRLREMAFNFESDSYLAPDIAILSEHLLRSGGITRMAYLGSPDSIILAVSGTGELLSLTYERPEQVLAWSHHITGADQDVVDGKFETVATAPNFCGTGDEAWVILKRIINGSTVRYVEFFDGQLNTDSALIYSGSAVDRFRGLRHLEGEVVKVVTADFTVYTVTVTNGEVQIGASTTYAEIGLNFSNKLSLLPIEIPTQIGTAQMRRKRWNQFGFRLFCTRGTPKVQGEDIRYPLEATFPYTGDILITAALPWDLYGRVVIQHDDPLPMTVLSASGSLLVDDG